MSDEKPKELRVVLEPEIFDKLRTVQKWYGIQNQSEMMRLLITDKYRAILREVAPEKVRELIED